MKSTRHTLNRRRFLARTAGAALASAAFPQIIPSSALGADGAVAPSNRIAVACIGNGPQGAAVMRGFLAQKAARVVAVCDVKSDQREQARGLANQNYQNQDCKSYVDFREILSRPDIDACLIAAPDHWHVAMGIAAVRAGKDVYVEKPMGCSVAEGQAMRQAARRVPKSSATSARASSSPEESAAGSPPPPKPIRESHSSRPQCDTCSIVIHDAALLNRPPAALFNRRLQLDHSAAF